MSDATGTSGTIAERVITVRGLRLATAVNTIARTALARPALVILPAAGFVLAAYRPILERYASERRVAALDWPGFGGSSRPSPADFSYSAAAYAELLDPWLAAVGASRFVLLGHAVGGATALHYTQTHAERVAGLVLVAPWSLATLSPLRSLGARALSMPRLLGLLEPTRTSLALGPANPATRTILADHRAARRAPEHAARLAAEAALLRSQRLPAADLRGPASALRAPAIVVRGALDPLFTAADARRATDALGSRGALQVVLPNAGHLPWLQQPAPFMGAVSGLLETAETS